jgi:hypothetical protein
MEADVERTCLIILTGEAAATDAPYGTVANMKPLCSIQPDETTFDAELLFFLNKAADFIHTPLLQHETTLPLTTVPAIIATIQSSMLRLIFDEEPVKKRTKSPQLPYYAIKNLTNTFHNSMI